MLRRNVRLVHYLSKKYPVNRVTVSVQRFQSTHKKDEYKKECPPDSSGRGFYVTVGGIIIGTGAVVAYAKYDEDFRNWIKDNISWFDRFIVSVTAEEKTYIEQLIEFLEYSKESIVSTFSSIEKPGAKKEDICEEVKKAKEAETTEDGDAPPDGAPGAPAPPAPPPPPAKELPPMPGGASADTDVTGSYLKLSDILERLQKLRDSTDLAYKEALCVYKDLSDFYNKVVDGSVSSADPSALEKIKELRTTRSEAMKTAEDKYRDALTKVDGIKAEVAVIEKVLKKTTLLSADQKEAVDQVRHDIKDIIKDLDDTKKLFEKEKARLSLTEKYWKQVQEARKHFSEELEILFPNVRIQDKNMKLADEELDLFILYAFQNILYYQKELNKLDSMYKASLDKSLSSNVKPNEKDTIRAVIENEMESERRKIGAEFQKRMLTVRAECERDMRQNMVRQAEAHVAHIKELTKLKERQAEMNLQRLADEKMADLRHELQVQLADIIARMRALDVVVKKKMEADTKAGKSQELWSACQALEEALHASDPSQGLFRQFRPLESLVEGVYASAAPGDEYVDAVLTSLPVEARRRGVFTSLMLKDRFISVKRVAKKVALLPEGGAPLPVMFLSWLQSKLIIETDEIPVDELTNKEFDPSLLNTFQILQRANYWMERGEYKQALGYMNLLSGAPRAVAGDWIREMQIYLEVAQAARALMAYAAAAATMNQSA